MAKWLFADARMPARLEKWLERVRRSPLGSRLARGALWSLVATASSRAFTVIAAVVTARVIGRDDFGALGMLTSTLGVFQLFAGLGLGVTSTKYVAEFRVRDPERAGRVLAMSSLFGAAAGTVATFALYAGAPWLCSQVLDAPHLTQPMRIASGALLFASLGGTTTGALSGLEAFSTQARISVITGAFSLVVTVGAVLFHGLTGAVWATTASAAFQWVISQIALRKHAKSFGIPLSMKGWKVESGLLWTYSLPALAAGALVGPVQWAASAMLVRSGGGLVEMGVFTAANQLFGAVLMLPAVLGTALLPIMSERIGESDSAGVAKLMRTSIGLNGAVVLPFVAIGVMLSPVLMAIYGEAFSGAWPTLVVSLLTAGLLGIIGPVGVLLTASGRLWLGLSMNLVWGLVYLVGAYFLSGRGALGLAAARLFAYVVHSVWTLMFAARHLRASPQRTVA